MMMMMMMMEKRVHEKKIDFGKTSQKDVLISHVFARLLIDSNDFESVSRLSRTNKYLSEISRDEEMWRAALNKK